MLELVIRVVVSLGVVLGLFWAVTRLGSRKLGGRDRALVRVRSRQALSRGSSLAVVEVGSRVLVVGVSDAGVRLLTELDPFELETDVSDLTELPVTLAAPQSVTELDGLSAPLSDGGSAGTPAGQPVAAAATPSSAPAGAGTSARTAGRHAASRHTAAASSSVLGGSLLAPTTWRQAWAAATGRSAAETPAEAAGGNAAGTAAGTGAGLTGSALIGRGA